MRTRKTAYTVEELSSIAEIRNVQERYCRGIDRADADIFRTVYWEDGYDEHGVLSGDREQDARSPGSSRPVRTAFKTY